MRGLQARLLKLEKRYQPILLCLSCQYWEALGKHALKGIPSERNVAIHRCPLCGTKYSVDVKNCEPLEREVVTLIVQADPIERYLGERYNSAAHWYRMRKSEIKSYQEALKSEDKSRFFFPYPKRSVQDTQTAADLLSPKEKKEKRALEDLRKRADSQAARETERIKRLLGAPEIFSVDKTIEQVRLEVQCLRFRRISEILHDIDRGSEFGRQLEYELNMCFVHLENLKMRQAHEVVLWKQTLRITENEVRFFLCEIEKRAARALRTRVRLRQERQEAANKEEELRNRIMASVAVAET